MLWLGCVSLAAAVDSKQPRPWMDSSLGVEQRVKLLLAEMTNGEKAAQLDYRHALDFYQI